MLFKPVRAISSLTLFCLDYSTCESGIPTDTLFIDVFSSPAFQCEVINKGIVLELKRQNNTAWDVFPLLQFFSNIIKCIEEVKETDSVRKCMKYAWFE